MLEIWLLGLIETLSDFEGVKTYPSTLVLTGGGTKIPEIKEAVQRPDWPKTLAFKNVPEVKVASIESLPVEIKNDIKVSQEDIVALSVGLAGLELWGGKNLWK